MTTASEFAKMVPGFDFLQGLLKNAGAGLPQIGQWVAPTLNPEELGKRIDELRTVQFWLEQNAKLLGTTIQALEVQRMTLSTLKGMNMSMGELRDSLKAAVPGASAASSTPQSTAVPLPEVEGDGLNAVTAALARRRASGSKSASPTAPPPAPAAAAAPGLVDPTQWWGALTQQFTELAGKAARETGADLARNMASAVAGAVVQQGVQAAGATLKKAAQAPGQMLKAAADMAKGAGAATAPGARSARRANASPNASPNASSSAKTRASTTAKAAPNRRKA